MSHKGDARPIWANCSSLPLYLSILNLSWPQGYRTFLMLHSTEHEVSFARKNESDMENPAFNPSNKCESQQIWSVCFTFFVEDLPVN